MQITTFLSGPFGGYGSFIRAEPGRTSYNVDPFVESRAANKVKAIVYMPGCEIVKVDLKFSGTPIQQQLDCVFLPKLKFQGRLSADLVSLAGNAEVNVEYLAEWDHPFFNIGDGMVTQINLGSVRPDASGRFEINVPDFYQQRDLGEASLSFILRQIETGNIIAFLTPANERKMPMVKIQPSYPVIEFSAIE